MILNNYKYTLGKRILLWFLNFKNYDFIFMWTMALFSILIQPLLNTYYLSSFTTVMLLCLSIISFICIAFYKRKPDLSLLVVIISFGIVLSISNGIFSASNGGGPILLVTEMFYSVVLIYRYGVRKTWWIPLIFITLSYVHLYSYESQLFDHWIIDDPIAFKYYIYFFIVGSALFIFSMSFSKKLDVLVKKLTIARDRLSETKDEVESQTKDLEKAYEAIKKISNHNSHDLRRPVARIIGLLQLYNDMGQELELVESMLGKSLQEEINLAMQEMQEELQEFEDLIKVNVN